MDVVHRLIRQVVRDFYDTRAVIVVEALLVHHVLTDRELASLMGLPTKDLRMICARLKEDHLLKEVNHKDDATSQFRTFMQTMYYIHFTEAVDAIKWKMHYIENKLREEMDAQHNPQDYVCDTCKTRYKTLDALSNFDPELGTFLCEVCGSPLREDDGPNPEEGSSAQDKMEELMTQLKPLISILRQIDDLTIPENTFDSESQLAVPLPSPEDSGEPQGLHPVTEQLPSGPSGITVAGSAGSRLPQAVQASFQVHITSEEEQAAQAADAVAEKKRLAEENSLPDWHARSTVGFGPTPGSGSRPGIVKAEPNTVKAEEPAAKQLPTKSEEDAMDAYYRKLQEEQSQANGQGEGEDEEEDDDEFEDVEV